jgi:hypothetical protein
MSGFCAIPSLNDLHGMGPVVDRGEIQRRQQEKAKVPAYSVGSLEFALQVLAQPVNGAPSFRHWIRAFLLSAISVVAVIVGALVSGLVAPPVRVETPEEYNRRVEEEYRQKVAEWHAECRERSRRGCPVTWRESLGGCMGNRICRPSYPKRPHKIPKPSTTLRSPNVSVK